LGKLPSMDTEAGDFQGGDFGYDLDELYGELARAPEDWSVRLRLVEAAVSRGDLTEAKRLVRTSPDEDTYLPAELQDRIRWLLTEGIRRSAKAGGRQMP
jgi:hypothetical protein